MLRALKNKLFGTKQQPCDEFLYCDDRQKALARYIVKDIMPKKLDGVGISKESEQYVHLIVVGTDRLLINVARQVALNCHFPNFNEENGNYRTLITFIVENANTEAALKSIKSDLDSVLGNLTSYCKCTLHNADWSIRIENPNVETYIDIEIEVIGLNDKSAADYLVNLAVPDKELVTVVGYADTEMGAVRDKLERKYHQVVILDREIVNVGDDKLLINTNSAQLVNWIYCIGLKLNNIRASEIEQVNIYEPYIREYTKNNDLAKMTAKWNELEDSVKVSNVLCADGFEYRLRCIGLDIDASTSKINKAIKTHLPALSRVEHNRWNVEKLIMGYRPLNKEELWHDGSLNGAARTQWHKELKAKHIHIDICSYRTLRRIDPNSVKYDSFIMLAIPYILSKSK